MVFGGRREDKESHESNEPRGKTIEIDAQMQGTLSFKDNVDLKINGSFTGTLEAKGTLTIGDSASVEAHITGDNIVIAGKVHGDIIAKKMLVLMPTAVLSGNISTPKLNIVEGAIFQGKCHMQDDAVQPQGDLLSISEVAKYLEIDSPSILELADNGKIPAVRQGDSWAFERGQIDHWASTERVK